jgi:putative transposase
MAGKALQMSVTKRQRAVLEQLVRTRTLAQHLAERCRIILGSADGRRNLEQAASLGVDRQRIRRWRGRWSRGSEALERAESKGVTEEELEAKILELLSDNYRSGTPAKFTPEQVVSIIAVACEPPADSDRPISQWSPRELAEEVIKRGIVDSISPRQVDRFLAKRT